MEKVSKRKALQLFNKGVTIHLCSSKITPQIIQHSPWFSWYKIKKSIADEQGETFETCVNSFENYNCTNETGLRVNYYVYNCDLT